MLKQKAIFSDNPKVKGSNLFSAILKKNAVKHPEQAARAESAALADLAASAERDFSLKELGRAAKTNLRSFD